LTRVVPSRIRIEGEICVSRESKEAEVVMSLKKRKLDGKKNQEGKESWGRKNLREEENRVD